jgi:hypothetical protein
MYIRAMGKKKEGEDREKSLPQEIFGQAMISHGGQYTSESAYGQALLRLGSTMERMARLQEVPATIISLPLALIFPPRVLFSSVLSHIPLFLSSSLSLSVV